MIAAKALPTWRLAQMADGVVLTPPEGAHLGLLRIREAQRPLRSAARIFAASAAQLTGATVEPGAIERMITCEGELAAIQLLRGTGPDGQAILRCLGAVFGDDAYTLIDAGTSIAERFAFFEQAARTFTFYTSLGLGHRRRRRFEYAAPAGWGGIARELDAVWMPPGFPGVRALLTVHAARPADAAPAEIRDAILQRLALTGLSDVVLGDTERRFTDHELSGVAWRATGHGDGAPTHIDVVVLEDDRFLYPFELVSSDAALAEARAALDAVVASSSGVPLPEAQPQIDSLLHWAT